MYTLIMSSGSATLTPDSELAVEIIQFQIDGTSTSVNVSGVTTGSLITADTNLEGHFRFQPDETVILTKTGSADAVINYIYVGDQTGYMECNTGRSNVQMNLPWWATQ